MMILVIGGSGSGKSSYAEDAVAILSQRGDFQKYYLVTMQVVDSEGRKKVERHRTLRAGRGFLTIEQPADIYRALGKMRAEKRIVLLECIANLTANEMFSGGSFKSAEQVSEKIIREIKMLREETAHLAVVSNTVFEDGTVYDEGTMVYLRAMGTVNQALAAMADCAVEIVAGIPVVIKGREGGKDADF